MPEEFLIFKKKLCILVYLRNVMITLMQICISKITTTSYIELAWYADPFRFYSDVRPLGESL